jgi:hypothetical protein
MAIIDSKISNVRGLSRGMDDTMIDETDPHPGIEVKRFVEIAKAEVTLQEIAPRLAHDAMVTSTPRWHARIALKVVKLLVKILHLILVEKKYPSQLDDQMAGLVLLLHRVQKTCSRRCGGVTLRAAWSCLICKYVSNVSGSGFAVGSSWASDGGYGDSDKRRSVAASNRWVA